MRTPRGLGISIARWGLFVAGVVLLLFWAYGLFAYGWWVDENAAVGVTRPIDVVLFTAGMLCWVAAIVTPTILKKVAARRPQDVAR